MAGLIKLPHILEFKFISPQLLGPVILTFSKDSQRLNPIRTFNELLSFDHFNPIVPCLKQDFDHLNPIVTYLKQDQ